MVSLTVDTMITLTHYRSRHLNEQFTSLWQNSQFRIYLGTTAFTGTATAMQQLLLSWLLVGILLLPADQVGMIQAVIGLPGIVLMLWGGASADRTDARSFLLKVYAVAWLFPLALFGMTEIDLLNIWTVSLFGIDSVRQSGTGSPDRDENSPSSNNAKR